MTQTDYLRWVLLAPALAARIIAHVDDIATLHNLYDLLREHRYSSGRLFYKLLLRRLESVLDDDDQ